MVDWESLRGLRGVGIGVVARLGNREDGRRTVWITIRVDVELNGATFGVLNVTGINVGGVIRRSASIWFGTGHGDIASLPSIGTWKLVGNYAMKHRRRARRGHTQAHGRLLIRVESRVPSHLWLERAPAPTIINRASCVVHDRLSTVLETGRTEIDRVRAAAGGAARSTI